MQSRQVSFFYRLFFMFLKMTVKDQCKHNVMIEKFRGHPNSTPCTKLCQEIVVCTFCNYMEWKSLKFGNKHNWQKDKMQTNSRICKDCNLVEERDYINTFYIYDWLFDFVDPS